MPHLTPKRRQQHFTFGHAGMKPYAANPVTVFISHMLRSSCSMQQIFLLLRRQCLTRRSRLDIRVPELNVHINSASKAPPRRHRAVEITEW